MKLSDLMALEQFNVDGKGHKFVLSLPQYDHEKRITSHKRLIAQKSDLLDSDVLSIEVSQVKADDYNVLLEISLAH